MTVDTSIFKAYDIRGVYPTSISEDLAYKIGQGYVNFVLPRGPVVVGHDIRLHSIKLKDSLIRGLTEAGCDVVDIGLVTTDMYYFAVGKYGFAGGIQVTASHNPPEWNGFKMVKEGVVPLTLESGINQIKDFISSSKSISGKKGKIENENIEKDYFDYILGWIKGKIKPFKITTNANFGYSGKIFEKIIKYGNLPVELVTLNHEPNGSFPKGRPDPFIPENRPEFLELVKSSNSDFGIAWDADGDRVFFAADSGVFLEPYHLNTILIKQMLKNFPKEKIIYDPRYTWALIDAINESGGEPVLVRVGHSYIKEGMRKYNALFATESSGHTYYRDYWYADCGMLPPMQILQFLSGVSMKLSEIIKPIIEKYPISGEINSTVEDKIGKMEEIAKKYKRGKQSRLDGISVEYEDWRFTVRPSNTEPLLRLTLEAKTQKLVGEKTKEVLDLIRGND